MKRDKLKDLTVTLIVLIMITVMIFSTPQVLRIFLETDYPLEVVVSGSMVPTLQVGDLVIVKGGFSGEEINVGRVGGDIIIFPRPGNPSELIAHRAIEKHRGSNGFYFRTKGDNNSMPDGWLIFEGEIVGKVIGRIPLLGYLFMFLQTPSGLAIAVALLLLLMLSDLIGFSE